jgi:hypothetical protein
MARKVRVPGGYTVFHWNNEVIAFANEVRVTSVQPVVGPEVIQPLNYLRPAEIVTPRASTYGTITLVLTELYNEAVWYRLSGLADSTDIIDIFEYVAAQDNGIKITRWVKPPQGNPYSETYEGCVVVRVADDETVNVTTIRLEKEIELWYTHSRKNGFRGIPNSSRRPTFFT